MDADKMDAEYEISDYFQKRQSKGWYQPLMGDISLLWAISYAHASIYKKPYYLLRLVMSGSRNLIWRSSKPEVPKFQFMEDITTWFKIIIPRFRDRAIQWCQSQHCHTTTDGLTVRISLLTCVQVEIRVLPDWRPPSWIYHFRLGRTVLPLEYWIQKT